MMDRLLQLSLLPFGIAALFGLGLVFFGGQGPSSSDQVSQHTSPQSSDSSSMTSAGSSSRDTTQAFEREPTRLPSKPSPRSTRDGIGDSDEPSSSQSSTVDRIERAFDSTSEIDDRSSETRDTLGSDTQGSNTQGSNTQGSITQGSVTHQESFIDDSSSIDLTHQVRQRALHQEGLLPNDSHSIEQPNAPDSSSVLLNGPSTQIQSIGSESQSDDTFHLPANSGQHQLRMPAIGNEQQSTSPMINAPSDRQPSRSQSPSTPQVGYSSDRQTNPTFSSRLETPLDLTPQRTMNVAPTQGQHQSPNDPAYDRWNGNAIEPIPNHLLERIDEQIRYGESLAKKGAMFSARNHLIASLRMIAQARDLVHGSDLASNHLQQALRALNEAKDFVQHDSSGLAVPVDIDRTIDRHVTPVLKYQDIQVQSNLEAVQAYYDFAGEHLVIALGREPLASQALFALGKLEIMPDVMSGEGTPSTHPLAVVYFQAAVAIDPSHFRSANELAVQYVGVGDMQSAKRLLLTSIATQPTVAAWFNLAFVHQSLGEWDLAQLAQGEAMRLEQTLNANGAGQTASSQTTPHFMPVEQFNQQSGSGGVLPTSQASFPSVPNGVGGNATPNPNAASANSGRGPWGFSNDF